MGYRDDHGSPHLHTESSRSYGGMPCKYTKEPTKLSLHKNRWFTAAAFAIGISMLLLVK